MAQLVASMSGVVLGGVVEVVGSNLARGKIFTASFCSVDSLYPSVYIFFETFVIYIYISQNVNLKIHGRHCKTRSVCVNVDNNGRDRSRYCQRVYNNGTVSVNVDSNESALSRYGQRLH